jgi:hypothetical protein
MNVPLIKNLTWLFIAIILALAIQVPMLWHGKYAFLFPNTLIVVVSVLALRNTLEFEQVAWHRSKWFRYIVFTGNIFLFLYLLNRLEALTGVIDSMRMSALIESDTISLSESVDLFKYINKEYIVITIASFVAMIVYNVKILRSFWKNSTVKRERKLI